MIHRRTFALGIVATGFLYREASAQGVAASDAIARLFTSPKLQQAWFAPALLATVPFERIQPVLSDIVGSLGTYKAVAPNGKAYTVTFARGSIQADVTLNGEGAFTGLHFSRMQSASAERLITALFQTATVPADWFGPAMLTSVKIEQLRDMLGAMQQQLGAFQTTKPAADGTYDVTFAKGVAAASIFIGADGKIEGLIFQPKS